MVNKHFFGLSIASLLITLAQKLPLGSKLPLLFSLLFAVACGPALPVHVEKASDDEVVRVAKQWAEDAKMFAEQARSEQERAELLLKDATFLLERAEKAQRECTQLSMKIKSQVGRAQQARRRAEVAQPKVPSHSPSDSP